MVWWGDGDEKRGWLPVKLGRYLKGFLLRYAWPRCPHHDE